MKLAATDQNSRDVGVNLGAYLREVTFYGELRDRIGGDGTLAKCHLAAHDPKEGWFTLVLEDVDDGVQGDQIAGCGARRGANRDGGAGPDPRAGVRRPRARRDRLAEPAEPAQPGAADRAAARLPRALSATAIAPEHAEVCRALRRSRGRLGRGPAARRSASSTATTGSTTCSSTTGPARSSTGRRWAWGPAMRDAAYFLGGALPVEERRAHEESLLRAYHDELLAQGVAGFSWEQCWEEYRRQCFLRPGDDDRPGDGRRADRARRRHVHDGLRPRRAAGDRPRRRRAPARAGRGGERRRCDRIPPTRARHEPGPEELWNESWYFDAISDDGGARRLPPDRAAAQPRTPASSPPASSAPAEPAIMLVDSSAPLPPADDEAQAVDHRGDQGEPALRRAARAIPGGGRGHGGRSRRSLGAASRRGRGAGRDRARPDLGDRRRALRSGALRPATRSRAGSRGTVRVGERGVRASRPGPARPLVGRARLVGGDWMWSAPAPRRRHPHPRRRRSRPTRTSASATCSATAS